MKLLVFLYVWICAFPPGNNRKIVCYLLGAENVVTYVLEHRAVKTLHCHPDNSHSLTS